MASIRRRPTETAHPIRRQSTGNPSGGHARRGIGIFVDADKAGDVNGEVKERLHHCSLCSHSYFHKGDLNRHVRMVRVEPKARELDTRAVHFPTLLEVCVTSRLYSLLLDDRMLTSCAEPHASSGILLVS